jgi:glycosyltransferase involved in cell wall biosynthesis
MSASQNILIIFPHNFLERNSGVNKRYFEFISWLNEKGFTIDLLGLTNFQSSWENFESENSNGLIRKLFLYDFRTGYHKQRILSLFANLNFISKKGKTQSKGQLPDYAFPGMVSMFNKIISENKYEYIIIGYVYWANLLKANIPSTITKILTIEDFVTLKLVESKPGSVNIEGSVNEEVDRVNLFDKVICLSHEELQFFSANALHPEYFHVPVFMNKPIWKSRPKEYDLLFIGYDNADNIEGLDWFFKNVYQLLTPGLKMVVIGKIARYVPALPNVKTMDYVADLGEIYAACKVSINPLQKGTGMKVKVVESLAYGIPMVNTLKGLCGIHPEIIGRFIVADEPRHFAAEIDRLLSDSQWYDEQCNEAINTFDNHFDVRVARKELDRIF